MPPPDQTVAELLLKLGVPDTQTAYEQAHQLGVRVWELAGDRDDGDSASVLERALQLLGDDADDDFRREQWAAALRWAAGSRKLDELARAAHHATADQIEACRLTPWADTPEPSTPPTQQPHDAPAGAVGHPGTPDGPAVLGRALLGHFGVPVLVEDERGNWGSGFVRPVPRAEAVERFAAREVLLVRPEVGRVLEAARQWVRAWDADPFGPATSVAKAALADAVDALDQPTSKHPGTGPDNRTNLDSGEGSPSSAGEPHDQSTTGGPDHDGLTGAPIPPLDLTDAERDAFVALAERDSPCADPGCGCCYPGGLEEAQPTGEEVLRYATFVAGHPDTTADARHRAAVQAVIGGMLQDGWRRPAESAPEPSPLDATDCPRHTTWRDCAVASCPPPQEPAPEPAGDGPGWERARVQTIIGAIALAQTDDDAGQLRALLADRDRQAGLYEAEHQALEAALVGVRTARGELTEVRAQMEAMTAERDRWRTAAERYSQQREDLRGEVKAKEQRIADILRRLEDARAELDRLRADHLLIPKDRLIGYRVRAGYTDDTTTMYAPADVEIVVRGDLGQEGAS